jgi:IS5 family transposase
MLGKKKDKKQLDLFRSRLDQIINENHELVLLSNEVDWGWIENEFAELYSYTGRPSVPVRTMVSLLLLKQLYNQSDESVIDRWIENPYWQYFSGETFFQHKAPFNPTDFVHFRKRVGEKGMEKILGLTVKLHPGSETGQEVQIDTTVQEKNITYPTDTKMQMRIMEYVRQIADQEDIKLRQSYKFKVKKLQKIAYNSQHPKRRKKAKKARKKIKTLCGRMLRDLERKMAKEQQQYYQPWLELYWQVWNQKRNDKDKIYSLHEPEVYCVSKGKAHKKYEYGCKVAIVRNGMSGIITGIMSFAENLYDGHTLEPALEQCERIRNMVGGYRPQIAWVDRGCKGKKKIGDTQIMIPGPAKKSMTAYQKRKIRGKFRARAAIEPVIGHLKHDHGMLRNYLSGTLGDTINAILAGAAFNIKARLNQLKQEIKSIFYPLLNQIFEHWKNYSDVLFANWQVFTTKISC